MSGYCELFGTKLEPFNGRFEAIESVVDHIKRLISKGFQIEGEPDGVFGSMSDFENEEDEWDEYEFEDGDNEFATGVTFDELTTVGAWLEQDTLEPAQQQKAVEIVQRLQGTELLSLLENSMDGASRKIAELLDKNLSVGTDFSSPDVRKSDLEGFDIGEFV